MSVMSSKRQVVAAARAEPALTIVLNHTGVKAGPVFTAAELAAWEAGVAAVAECPNVVCKVGGIQMVPPLPLSNISGE